MGLLDTLTDVLRNALAQSQTQPGAGMPGQGFPRPGMPGEGSTPDIMEGGTPGGLQDLIERLNSGGLGEQVHSWLGNGANLPVSTDQIREALGDEHVQEIARQFGFSTDRVLDYLSDYLPEAVDKASPNGTIEPPTH